MKLSLYERLDIYPALYRKTTFQEMFEGAMTIVVGFALALVYIGICVTYHFKKVR